MFYFIILLYLEKESRSDIETWSINRILNKEHFYGQSMYTTFTKR